MNQSSIPEELKAKSVPPLGTLYFYLTGDCNMACRHCWIAPTFENSDRSQKALPFDLFKKIITEAKEAGLSGVKLTGGEPFIHHTPLPQISLREEFDDWALLYNPDNGRSVGLTPTGVTIWQSLSARIDLDGIIKATYRRVRSHTGGHQARYQDILRSDRSGRVCPCMTETRRLMKTPKSVDLDITSRCNLKCRYCFHRTSPADTWG